MRVPLSLLAGLILPAIAALPLVAEQTKPQVPKSERNSSSDPEKFLLRYKFQPGETIRWQVVHRAKIVTTVSGTTQTAETLSSSVKLWRVTKVNDDGTTTFENIVESVDMSQKLTGRAELRYNSRKDEKPPLGFENVAASLGIPLSAITLDQRGKIVRREHKDAKAAAQSEGLITILLPEGPVAVGQTWTLSFDGDVPLPSGMVKKIKLQQKYTLASARNGVATIEVATQILTPINDPALEALVIQRESHGSLRFDIEAGRVIGQQMDLDRRVVGFRGEASSLHYVTQFTEELLSGQPTEQEAETASRPKSAAAETGKR
jgi:hypothetical protein